MQACSIITDQLPETRKEKSLFDAVVASLPILRYLNNILNNATLSNVYVPSTDAHHIYFQLKIYAILQH